MVKNIIRRRSWDKSCRIFRSTSTPILPINHTIRNYRLPSISAPPIMEPQN
jgi:hypothetical protein